MIQQGNATVDPALVFASAGSQDVSDDDIIGAATSAAATSFADLMSPADVVGDGEWAAVRSEMSPGDLVNLEGQIGFDWDFNTAPSEKARRMWKVGMTRGFQAEYSRLDQDIQLSSADRDEAMVERIRSRRNGGR